MQQIKRLTTQKHNANIKLTCINEIQQLSAHIDQISHKIQTKNFSDALQTLQIARNFSRTTTVCNNPFILVGETIISELDTLEDKLQSSLSDIVSKNLIIWSEMNSSVTCVLAGKNREIFLNFVHVLNDEEKRLFLGQFFSEVNTNFINSLFSSENHNFWYGLDITEENATFWRKNRRVFEAETTKDKIGALSQLMDSLIKFVELFIPSAIREVFSCFLRENFKFLFNCVIGTFKDKFVAKKMSDLAVLLDLMQSLRGFELILVEKSLFDVDSCFIESELNQFRREKAKDLLCDSIDDFMGDREVDEAGGVVVSRGMKGFCGFIGGYCESSDVLEKSDVLKVVKGKICQHYSEFDSIYTAGIGHNDLILLSGVLDELDSEMAFFSRHLASSIISTQITRQQETLEISLHSNFSHFVSSRALQKETNAVVMRLRQYSQSWNKVLQRETHHRIMGMLVSCLLRHIVEFIMSLEDIIEDDSVALGTVYSLVDRMIYPIFDGCDDVCERFVGGWKRFRFLHWILTEKMVVIGREWAEGGEFREYFSPREVTRLIQAIFCNSPKRSEVLALIK